MPNYPESELSSLCCLLHHYLIFCAFKANHVKCYLFIWFCWSIQPLTFGWINLFPQCGHHIYNVSLGKRVTSKPSSDFWKLLDDKDKAKKFISAETPFTKMYAFYFEMHKNSWFLLKSARIGDWRLSRNTYEMRISAWNAWSKDP